MAVVKVGEGERSSVLEGEISSRGKRGEEGECRDDVEVGHGLRYLSEGLSDEFAHGRMLGVDEEAGASGEVIDGGAAGVDSKVVVES